MGGGTAYILEATGGTVDNPLSTRAYLTVALATPPSFQGKKTLVYGFATLLSEERPDGTYYVMGDQVGSPNLMTDADGVVVGRTKNLPFGERFGAEGVQSTRRFTNHEDQPGSAIYMQARTYLPAYGKFAQVDPAYDQTKDDPETWNLYSYVTNNPVTHTDPDGRTATTIIDDVIMDPQMGFGSSFGRQEGALQTWDRAGHKAEEDAVERKSPQATTETSNTGKPDTTAIDKAQTINLSGKNEISERANRILSDSMKEGGVTSLTITDTARSVQQQAEAMYNNAVKDLAYQKTLYDAGGNKVLSAYEKGLGDGNSKEQIIASMASVISGIKETNPMAFKHTVNRNVMETIDISLRSITPASGLNGFIKALGGYSGNINVIREPQNQCLHVEIKMWYLPSYAGCGRSQ